MAERVTRRQMLARSAMALGGLVVADGSGPGAQASMDRAHALGTAGEHATSGAACIEGARVRWIVGWTPGGGFDTYSRLAQPFIEKALGVQIAIDNVAGAGGLVGARTLGRARPDGRTLGILNGSGYLWNRDPDVRTAPDLARDFTVLARVSRRQQVIVASPASGLKTLDDLVVLAKQRPVIAGITSPDSANFAALAAVTDLFGLRTEFVAGYPGSREMVLALAREDFEITSMDIETYIEIPGLESMNALLQITPERSRDDRLAGTPHLAGPTGLVSVRPELFAGSASHVSEVTAAITVYLEMGRLFAGPPGMPPALRDCVEAGIHAALSERGFAEAARRAGRSIDVLPGEEVRRMIPGAVRAARPIEQVTAAAVRRIR